MQRRDCDVVIIGAGVAGLAAAGELTRRGWRAAIIEARDRIGGRVHTVRSRGWRGPVELGAQFIHGGNAPFWRLAGRLRRGRVPDRHWRHTRGVVQPFDATQSIAKVTEGIDGRRMTGCSFADYLRRTGDEFTELQRDMALGFVEGFEAAPADEMSAVAVAGETLEDDEQYFLPGGYDGIVAALADRIVAERTSMFIAAPCRSVEWRRGAVEVRSPGLSVVGRAAVVTVPLGVLQLVAGEKGAIRFAPELRSHAAAARRMGMGHVIRITFRFEAGRWRTLLPDPLRGVATRGLGFVHARPKPIPVWWSLTGDPVVTGWAGGPAALACVMQSEHRIAQVALASLAEVLGRSKRDVAAAVAGWAMHNWSRDPFSRGAYSFTRAGAEGAAVRLRRPLKDTLFFAGEATADGAEVGTAHGALSSGLRAANEVMAAL